jgi:hypothetical protein
MRKTEIQLPTLFHIEPSLNMSRSLRIEVAGGLYHVMSRGDRRENIYEKTVSAPELPPDIV